MAPDSQCLPEEGVDETHHNFVTRVMALPALDQAATMYRVTKEQQHYFGLALRLAEAGILKTVAVTGAVMPLATPITNHVVGGLAVVDDWACQWLDNAVKAAPIIAKPTDEIVDDTRDFMMKSLAGHQPFPKPLTFKTALAARASDVAVRASATGYVRMVSQVVDSMLFSAHHVVDTYLPPAEGDLHHADGSEGGISTKAFSLAYKTQARLRRTVLPMLEKEDEANDDDEIVIYPLHLNENEYHRPPSWYENLSSIPYVKKATDTTVAVKSMVANQVGSLCQMATGAKVLFSTTVREGVGNVYSLVVTKGIDMSRSGASQGIHLGNSALMAAVAVMQNVISVAESTGRTTMSTAKAVGDGVMDRSVNMLTAISTCWANMTQAAVNHGSSLFHILEDMGKNEKTHALVAGLRGTIRCVREQGRSPFYAVKQYCTANLGNVLLMVPHSVYTTGHFLYVQFLLACYTYRERVLRTSRQAIKNIQSLPVESCIWLSNRKMFINTHLLVIHFQRRMSTFLTTVSLQSGEV